MCLNRVLNIVLIFSFQNEQFRIPNLFPLVSVAFIVFVVDFYIEAICSAKLESHVSSRIGSISSFIAALVIGYFWEHIPYADLMPYEIRKHGIAAGAVLATVCFIAGMFEIEFALKAFCVWVLKEYIPFYLRSTLEITLAMFF